MAKLFKKLKEGYLMNLEKTEDINKDKTQGILLGSLKKNTGHK